MARRFLGYGVVTLGLVAACSKGDPTTLSRGALVVEVRSNLAFPKDLDQVDLDVFTGNSLASSQTFSLARPEARLPFSTSWTPSVAPGTPLRIRALGRHHGNPVVLTERWISSPSKDLRVALLLDYLCWGSRSVGSGATPTDVQSACKGASTCIAGRCASGTERGVPGDSSSDPSTATGQTSGAPCVAMAGCFEGASLVPLTYDGNECFAPSPLPVSPPLSLALAPQDSSLGYCGNDGNCAIPLAPSEGPEGWHAVGNRLVVPPLSCMAGLRGVLVSTKCGGAFPEKAVCSTPPMQSERAEDTTGSASPLDAFAPPPGLKTDAGANTGGGVGAESPDPAPDPDTFVCPFGDTVGGGSSGANGATVEGTVTGLNGDGLVLVLNRSETYAVPRGATRFAFTQKLAPGEDYVVERFRDAEGTLTCTVQGGRGVVPKNGAVPKIVVRCEARPKIRQLTAGHGRMCALLENGTVRCWGSDFKGQLGSSTLKSGVPGLETAVRIGAGASNTCVITQSGGLRCWGDDGAGQLSEGSPIKDIPGLSGVEDVAVGGSAPSHNGYICAVLKDHTLRCWGDTSGLGIGPGSVTESIPGLSGVKRIAAGHGFACAVMLDSTVRCFGVDTVGQLAGSSLSESIDGLSGVVEVAAGTVHACARLEDGTVRCWGTSEFNARAGSSPSWSIDGLAGVVSIVAANYSTCVTLSDETVRCWGGEALGGPMPKGSSRYAPLGGLSGVAQIALDTNVACVVTKDNNVRCWSGQWGMGTPTNDGIYLPVEGLSGVTNIYSRENTTCALRLDGRYRCWGWGVYDSSPTQSFVGLPAVEAGFLSQVSTCVRTTDQSVRCWRFNIQGFYPTLDNIIPSFQGMRDFTGVNSTCGITAVLPNGTVVCTSDEEFIQGQVAPMMTVPGFTGVVGLARRDSNEDVCALRQDGTVVCGLNNPTTVPGLSGVIQIAGFADHICVLLADTTVRCWGSNEFGQTAGSSETRSIPGLSGVVEIAATAYHTCARLRNGRVRCWGDNTFGQTAGSSPTSSIPFLRGVTAIAAGRTHDCALLCNGHVHCWGSNYYGQITGTAQPINDVSLPP